MNPREQILVLCRKFVEQAHAFGFSDGTIRVAVREGSSSTIVAYTVKIKREGRTLKWLARILGK